MSKYSRMLGRALPVGCPVCRVEQIGPDCVDRAKTRRIARKEEHRRWRREVEREAP